MEKDIRTSYLRCQDGLHQGSEVGPGHTQNTRPYRVHFHWRGFMRECPNSLYICCAKWLTSVRGRYMQCIPSSTIFPEGLCCVWPGIRNRKHWESVVDSSGIIWGQKRGLGL